VKSYVISIACVAIICSISSLLSPEGEGGGLGKHVRLVAALVLTVVCISPAVSLIEAILELDLSASFSEHITDDSGRYEEIFHDSLDLSEERVLREGIADILCGQFEIDGDECDISFEISEGEDGRKLERIFILLRGSAIWKDTGEIERMLGEMFACEIITAIE
jgi:hypothetical protein